MSLAGASESYTSWLRSLGPLFLGFPVLWHLPHQIVICVCMLCCLPWVPQGQGLCLLIRCVTPDSSKVHVVSTQLMLHR